MDEVIKGVNLAILIVLIAIMVKRNVESVVTAMTNVIRVGEAASCSVLPPEVKTLKNNPVYIKIEIYYHVSR